MSWISDVKHDLGKLDLSLKSLKKFGATVGFVFLLLFAWFLIAEIFPAFRIMLLIGGFILILAALIQPLILRTAYKIWMGVAFILGWLVSRIILTLLFFLILTPIGLIAKIVGKKFIDADLKKDSRSNWIKKEETKINYEKMF